MVVVNDMITDFDDVVADIGQDIVVRAGSPTFTSDYDDETTTVSGGVSGVAAVQSVGGDSAGDDWKLLEMGKIEMNDLKLFVTGSIFVDENSIIDIQDSGTTFAVIQIIPYTSLAGSVIYREVFIRKTERFLA